MHKHHCPKYHPPPQFPPHKPKLFARTPPSLFPSLLGLIGLALVLRKGLASIDLLAGSVEVLIGALVVFWAFAVVALVIKIARRPAVLLDDLKVLPGRIGLTAATMSLMAMAGVILPYAPRLSLVMILLGLALHLLLALVLLRILTSGPPEARSLNPGCHLAFVGFIVAAPTAIALGQMQLATALFWITLPIAVVLWSISLAQLIARIPPAPLRPLLAIHLAPAALFTLVAAQIGQPVLAQFFAGVGAVILLSLIASVRWITAAGFSPLWGAFTFPLAAYALALLTLGGAWEIPASLATGAAFLMIPPIAWQVLKQWPTGRLAAKTNAIEA